MANEFAIQMPLLLIIILSNGELSSVEKFSSFAIPISLLISARFAFY
jgi:hypothetical protein